MLNQIIIHNFITINYLELDFYNGLTVITGETGAGKSIILRCIGLIAGDRASIDDIKQGAEKSDISVVFDLDENQHYEVVEWLNSRELLVDQQCILRRVITRKGKSKAFINGVSSTLIDLKKITSQLIDIHIQHESQLFLKRAYQQSILDHYAKANDLVNEIKNITVQYNNNKKKLEEIERISIENKEKKHLLTYYLQEFDALNLKEGECHQLEDENKQLGCSEAALSVCHQVREICDENDCNIQKQLLFCIRAFESLNIDIFSNVIKMLYTANIQIQESIHELECIQANLNPDPNRLSFINHRLDIIYSLAKKHRVNPEELIKKYHIVSNQLEEIDNHLSSTDSIIKKQDILLEKFIFLSNKLTEKRKKAASSLSKEVSNSMKQLGMKHGEFVVNLISMNKLEPNIFGNEAIEFAMSANEGNYSKPLIKVASGGELSRISLAIHVIVAKTSNIPSLVFDEVDVGIGGSTAEIVGNMLKELSKKTQVFCVTHQAQVASKGSQHLFVNKFNSKNLTTNTEVVYLHKNERVNEIARMIGGIKITNVTINHAKSLLNM